MTAAPAFARGAAPTRVEGPVAGGRRGAIYGAFHGDMAAHGYIEEEYFVAGTAQSFRPVGELGRDGRWQVVPDRRAPYKTRVIAHRPKDPAKFNGAVMADWTTFSTFSEPSNAVDASFWPRGEERKSVGKGRRGIG